VRGPHDRERPAAEERAPEVRGSATRATDDAAGRTLEWCVSSVEHPGGAEDPEGLRIAGDVQLKAGRSIERAAVVRANLGADPLVAEQRERPAGRCAAPEVEMEGPLSSATQVKAARRVEERGKLRPTIARP